MRCDQHMGITKPGQRFIDENLVEPEICETCHRPFPNKGITVVGKYRGMFDTEYPLHQYLLKDGRIATEYVQAEPWSSGPVFFIGLRVSDETDFLWSSNDIQNC